MIDMPWLNFGLGGSCCVQLVRRENCDERVVGTRTPQPIRASAPLARMLRSKPTGYRVRYIRMI